MANDALNQDEIRRLVDIPLSLRYVENPPEQVLRAFTDAPLLDTTMANEQMWRKRIASFLDLGFSVELRYVSATLAQVAFFSLMRSLTTGRHYHAESLGRDFYRAPRNALRLHRDLTSDAWGGRFFVRVLDNSMRTMLKVEPIEQLRSIVSSTGGDDALGMRQVIGEIQRVHEDLARHLVQGGVPDLLAPTNGTPLFDGRPYARAEHLNAQAQQLFERVQFAYRDVVAHPQALLELLFQPQLIRHELGMYRKAKYGPKPGPTQQNVQAPSTAEPSAVPKPRTASGHAAGENDDARTTRRRRTP